MEDESVQRSHNKKQIAPWRTVLQEEGARPVACRREGEGNAQVDAGSDLPTSRREIKAHEWNGRIRRAVEKFGPYRSLQQVDGRHLRYRRRGIHPPVETWFKRYWSSQLAWVDAALQERDANRWSACESRLLGDLRDWRRKLCRELGSSRRFELETGRAWADRLPQEPGAVDNRPCVRKQAQTRGHHEPISWSRPQGERKAARQGSRRQPNRGIRRGRPWSFWCSWEQLLARRRHRVDHQD